MGKIRRILCFLTLLLGVVFSTNSFAAGFMCDRVYYSCNSGLYLDDGICTQCPSEYPLSDGGSDGINSCYLSTTPGMYVATAGMGETYCESGHYCPGGVSVYYNGTGGKYVCGSGKWSDANASSCTDISENYYNTGCGTDGTGGVCSNDYTGGACAANATSSAGSAYCTCKINYVISGTTDTHSLNDRSGSTCVLHTHQVTFNLNCSSNDCGTAPVAQDCIDGEVCALPDGNTTSFHRAGYRFVGWSTNAGSSTGSVNLAFTSPTTVYAIWTACASGTYKNASATAASVCSTCPAGYPNTQNTATTSITECYSNSKQMASEGTHNEPTRPGCTNIGYNDCTPNTCTYTAYSNATGDGDGTIKEMGELTMVGNTPKCMKECDKTVVSVVAESGYFALVGATSCTKCSDQHISYPLSVQGTTDPNMCYRDCVSDTADANGTGDVVGSSTITGTVTAGGTITCQATGCMADYYLDGNVCVTCPQNADCPGGNGGFTCKNGYKLNTTGDGCVGETYTVTLNANGGTGGQASVTATFGQPMPTLSSVAELSTYSLTGYFDEQSGGNQYYDRNGQSTRNWDKYVEQSYVLYAHWSQNTIQCVAGKYYDGSAMQDCQSGYYCPGTGEAIEGGIGCRVSCGELGADYVASDGDRTTPESCYMACEADCYNPGKNVDCPENSTKCDYDKNGKSIGKEHYGSNTCERIGAGTCPYAYINCRTHYYVDSTQNQFVCDLCPTNWPNSPSNNDGNISSCFADCEYNCVETGWLESVTAPGATCQLNTTTVNGGIFYPTNICSMRSKCQITSCTCDDSGYTFRDPNDKYRTRGDLGSCDPNIYTITLVDDKNQTSENIYEKYATGWYSDDQATDEISGITPPTYGTWVFSGYYDAQTGGNLIIKSNGSIDVLNTTFKADTTLYARWTQGMFTCTAGLTASGQPCPNGSYCPTGEVPIEYKDIPDTGCEKICPSDDSNEIASTGDRKEITDCQTTRTGVDLNDGTGGGDQICKYVAQHQDPTKIGYTNCESVKIKYCNAGRYRVQTDSPTCAPVTAGFWSPAKSSTDDPISVARYSCNLLGVDGATTSGANAETSSSPTACQITCPDVNITDANNETIGVRHANPTTVNFSGTYNYSNGTVSGGYPTCTYDAPDCYPGYHTNGNTCEPNVYTFTLDKNGGTSGDNGPIYMKYYTGWYWDADATNPIETVNLPVQGDQNCSGYEVTIGATTTTIIDETGHIIVSNHYGDGSLPTDNSITLTASWTPKQGIQCQPGYYFSHTADNGAGACAPCPNGSWCPGGYAYNGPDNQGSDLYITACPSDSTKYTPAQTFNGTTLVDVAPDIGSDGQRSAESDCYATVKYVPSVDPRGAGSRVCHYAAGQYATNCNDVQILTCDSGYWLDTTKSTTNCSKAELQYYSGQYLTTRTRCPNAQYDVADSRNTIETDNDESDSVDACFQVGIWERTAHGGHTKRCHWNTSNDTYSINCGSSYVMRKCDSGYWDALEGAATDNEYIDCVPVGATYYSPAPANWDATTTTDTTSTTRQECPSGVGAQNVESTTASTTGTAATAKTDCYLTCKATITMSGTTSNVKNPDGRAYFDETQNGYELCLYDKCPAGMWCDENGLHNCPTDKDGNPGVADFDGEELRSIDKCYVTYNPYAATAGYPNHGWENGTGWATCFFLGDESTGDYSNCMNADALTCNAGYWYKVPGAFACSAVTNGYYSANGAITQTECPVGWAGSINEPANNNPAATYAACYKTCDAGTGDFAHSKTVNKASATVNAKSATEYNDCLYTIAECDTGYTPMGANTANPWCQPNTYTITLNKNGGMGTTAASVQCTFDSGQCALPAIVDTRDGYSTANKWCTTADGSGTCYDAGTTVTTNISATGTDTELFAKWTPNVYEITLNNNGALSAGAPGTVYLKYATGWYSNSATTRTITEMETLPTNGAQKFTGYKSAGDNGIMVIDSMGRFITTNPGALTFTTSNTTVTAQWADAPITCPEGTYYVGTGVDPNDENVCKACEENHYCGGTETQTNSGQSGLFECPDGGKSPAGSSDVSACYKELLPTYVATHGTGTQTCYYKEAASAYSDRCKDFAITACYAGYYRANTTDTDCTQVGVGNYSADAELVRHECPNGGTTAQDNKTAETVYECYKTNLGYAASDGTGTGTQSCWYSEGTGNSATYVRDCFDKVITACRGGYYRVNNDDIVCNVVDYNYYSIEGDIARHACPDDGKTSYQDTSTVAECWKNGQPYTAEHGGGERTCKWSVSDNTYLAGCGVPTMLYCDGGYYLANVATDTDCTMVGYAYYSPDRDLMRYSCATGQTTLTQTSDNANACFTCPANSVCAPGQGEKTCAELTGGQYTKSDVGTTDAAYCYKDCTMAENAGEMSGRDYYTADDTCAIAKCAEGYALLNGQCTICPEGSYCDGTPGDDGDGAKSCSDLGDGSWMYSDNGSTKASDCYRTCVEHMEGTCKLTPATGKAYWPNDCQYTGTSASGNPAEVINGVCVETECNSHYEMVNGTCEPCNRENALSYKPDGNCIVESCVMGYHPNGDKCEEDIVDCTENAPNATLAEQKWDAARGAYGVCMIKSCEADYHVASNACVANEQVCDIPNGVGTKTWNTVTKTWNPCIATSCVPGYTNDPSEKNNASEQCSECRNKFSVLGEVAVSSYSTGCEIASCMYQGEKYNLDNNECVPICTEGYSDETGYLHWNDRTKKCERNCYTDQGYMSW